MSKAKVNVKKKADPAVKSHLNSERKRISNKNTISEVRTYEKKVRLAVEAGDNAAARVVLSDMQSKIMKAVTKGVVKLGTASRKVARLAKLVKSMVIAS